MRRVNTSQGSRQGWRCPVRHRLWKTAVLGSCAISIWRWAARRNSGGCMPRLGIWRGRCARSWPKSPGPVRAPMSRRTGRLQPQAWPGEQDSPEKSILRKCVLDGPNPAKIRDLCQANKAVVEVQGEWKQVVTSARLWVPSRRSPMRSVWTTGQARNRMSPRFMPARREKADEKDDQLGPDVLSVGPGTRRQRKH